MCIRLSKGENGSRMLSLMNVTTKQQHKRRKCMVSTKLAGLIEIFIIQFKEMTLNTEVILNTTQTFSLKSSFSIWKQISSFHTSNGKGLRTWKWAVDIYVLFYGLKLYVLLTLANWCFVRSFVQPFFSSFIRSLNIHSFVRPFIQSFIHSCSEVYEYCSS